MLPHTSSLERQSSFCKASAGMLNNSSSSGTCESHVWKAPDGIWLCPVTTLMTMVLMMPIMMTMMMMMIMVEMSWWMYGGDVKNKSSPRSLTLPPGLLPEAFELSARVAQAPPRVRSAPCSPAQNHMNILQVNKWTGEQVNIEAGEHSTGEQVQSKWTSSSPSHEVSSIFTCAGFYEHLSRWTGQHQSGWLSIISWYTGVIYHTDYIHW